MRIRDSWNAMVARRSFEVATSSTDRSFRRISSGLRINTAADDASGLGIAQRLRAQYRGLIQANKNALDGVSALQTADGATSEIHQLLQRGRELSLQASNNIYGPDQLDMIQGELNGILREVDRISDGTFFNGRPLLNGSGKAAQIGAAVTGLRSGWLEQAENVVRTYYGLVGNGSPLKVVLETGGTDPTWISGSPGVGGQLTDLSLHISISDFPEGGGLDGGVGPLFNDRKTAKAVAQAVLAVNSNFANLDPWFISGSSDLVAGRNEKLKADLQEFGLGGLVSSLSSPWTNSSVQQSAAYLATRYLDKSLQDISLGMSDVMTDLKFGNDLDTALLNTVGLDSTSFLSDFVGNAASYLGSINIDPPDAGGLLAGDASAVIPNSGVLKTAPMTDWSISFVDQISAHLQVFDLQVGANDDNKVRVDLPEISTLSLNLIGVDVAKYPEEAIRLFDAAISLVTAFRTQAGSMQNRLEHTIDANAKTAEAELGAYSSIVDLDFFKEMTSMTKGQILVSSSGAMTAQANTIRENILTLLNSLGTPGS